MAINIFDQPANQQFIDSYVQLPYQELYAAGAATEKRAMDRMAEMEQMKQLYKDVKYVSWDQPAYDALQTELKNKVIKFAEDNPKLDTLEAQKQWYGLVSELQKDDRYKTLQSRYEDYKDYEDRKQKSVEEQGNQGYNFLEAEAQIAQDIAAGGIYGNDKTGFRFDNPNKNRLSGLSFTKYEADLRSPLEDAVNNMMTTIAETNPSWVTRDGNQYIVQAEYESRTRQMLEPAIEKMKKDYANSNKGTNLINKYMSLGYPDQVSAFNAGWEDIKNSVINEYLVQRSKNSIKADEYGVVGYGWDLQNQGIFLNVSMPTGQVKVNYNQLQKEIEAANNNLTQIQSNWEKVKDNPNDPNYANIKQQYNNAVKTVKTLTDRENYYKYQLFDSPEFNIDEAYKKYSLEAYSKQYDMASAGIEYKDKYGNVTGNAVLSKSEFEQLIKTGQTRAAVFNDEIVTIDQILEEGFTNPAQQAVQQGLFKYIQSHDGFTFKVEKQGILPTNKSSQINKTNSKILELIQNGNNGVLTNVNGTPVQAYSVIPDGANLSKSEIQFVAPTANSQPSWIVTYKDEDGNPIANKEITLSNDQSALMKEMGYSMLGEMQNNSPTEQTNLQRENAFTLIGQAEIGQALEEAAIYTLPKNGRTQLGNRGIIIERVPSAINDQLVFRLYDNEGKPLINPFAGSGNNQYFANEVEIAKTFGFINYVQQQ